MEKLKPCPWCGKKPKIRGVDGDWIRVGCLRFECEIMPNTTLYRRKKEAITAWNTRKA